MNHHVFLTKKWIMEILSSNALIRGGFHGNAIALLNHGSEHTSFKTLGIAQLIDPLDIRMKI